MGRIRVISKKPVPKTHFDDDIVFDFNKFKELSSRIERIWYCNLFLKNLGRGAGRVVYALDEERVLKVALKDGGIQQNKVECFSVFKNKCFCEILDNDEHFNWIIARRATNAKYEDFENIFGCTFDNIILWINKKGKKELVEEHLDKVKIFENINKNPFFNELKTILSNVKLTDINKINSWGKIEDKNGKEYLCIIDYGIID